MTCTLNLSFCQPQCTARLSRCQPSHHFSHKFFVNIYINFRIYICLYCKFQVWKWSHLTLFFSKQGTCRVSTAYKLWQTHPALVTFEPEIAGQVSDLLYMYAHFPFLLFLVLSVTIRSYETLILQAQHYHYITKILIQTNYKIWNRPSV